VFGETSRYEVSLTYRSGGALTRTRAKYVPLISVLDEVLVGLGSSPFPGPVVVFCTLCEPSTPHAVWQTIPSPLSLGILPSRFLERRLQQRNVVQRGFSEQATRLQAVQINAKRTSVAQVGLFQGRLLILPYLQLMSNGQLNHLGRAAFSRRQRQQEFSQVCPGCCTYFGAIPTTSSVLRLYSGVSVIWLIL
jgi:hypothetical protein